MLEALRKRMNVPKRSSLFTWKIAAIPVSSTIPIALREAMNQGKAKPGDTILLAGFGVGYSWAGTLLKL
ncbi:MAG: 3-oxoacyl-[acyl-carrier-protein] synthase III C-terminal domain-containing protein [Cytophagales bacterium]|nr:3-oxoacyl-[acyl-carrier-protein] synthase III C-terminal domain-containing protein [Cytophagales bacterium]